ncbi:S1C family serine protease [Sphingobacterium sp. SG20118]|uniref:S1C family serine protease n=1 Tax=Sphingobacterium TaxID=28453 RepID=UPI0004F8D0E2|nr:MULTISPECIES: serine protease [Sphingobacterium]AIM35760.1 protease Do [Sphingobacterium sp. ML3W]MDH5828112.1 serine protease [Sphingobacterium faecium]
MMSQQEFFELADRYLRDEMVKEERSSFESFCAENPSFSAQLAQHRQFLDTLQSSETRIDFKNQLAQSAKNYHRSQQHTRVIPMKQTKIVSLWAKLKASSLVAAAVAVLAVFSTLWLSGYYKNIDKANTDYSALKRDMNNVKKDVIEHNAALKSINNKSSKANEASASQFGATGFMVSNNGYVVTNYHVVSGADSIYLQNNKGESYKAQVIHSDPANDLAILLIEDTNFKIGKTLPYTFKTGASDLGEDIYTIGFPRDEAVYGQGYLSSATGYAGDTIAYQISIPVNPGNSGGPVMDTKGNVIGIISGKQRGIDGAAFAIKTKSILKALDEIPADSLQGQVKLNKKNMLSGLSRTEQIKRLQDYIYMVKVY